MNARPITSCLPGLSSMRGCSTKSCCSNSLTCNFTLRTYPAACRRKWASVFKLSQPHSCRLLSAGALQPSFCTELKSFFLRHANSSNEGIQFSRRVRHLDSESNATSDLANTTVVHSVRPWQSHVVAYCWKPLVRLTARE